MTPDGMSALAARLLRNTVTVTRSVNGDVTATATVRAKVAGYKPNELVGTIRQGDSNGVLLASDLVAANFPLPLQIGDLVQFAGVTLSIIAPDVGTTMLDDVTITIHVQLRG